MIKLNSSTLRAGIFLFVLCFQLQTYSQIYQEWLKTYTDFESIGNAVATDNKNNGIVAGVIYRDSVDEDIVVMKYDPVGNLKWIQFFDGGQNLCDSTNDVATDYKGNVFVTGKSYTDSSGFDFITIKYDSNGVRQWANRWSSPGNQRDVAIIVKTDQAGNCYIVGYSPVSGEDNIMIMSFKPDGTLNWINNYVGPGVWLDYPHDMVVDNSSNVYVACRSWDASTSYDFTTLKFGPTGSLLWAKKFINPWYDVANRICVDQFGNVYTVGARMTGDIGEPDANQSTLYDIYLIKYDQNGNEYWSAEFNGTGNGYDYPFGLAVDENSNVYVLGQSTNVSGDRDWVLIKYNSSGTQEWVETVNGEGLSKDVPNNLVLYKDYSGETFLYTSGYVTNEDNNYDFLTVKYDVNGVVKGIARYNDADNGNDYQYDMAVDKSGKVFVSGASFSQQYDYNLMLLKYSTLQEQMSYNINLVNPCLVDISGIDDIAIKDNYGYSVGTFGIPNISDYWYKMIILDFSDATNPVVIDTLKRSTTSPYDRYRIEIENNYAYVLGSSSGLEIYDLTNPLLPELKSTYGEDGDKYYSRFIISGNYLYACENNFIRIINISNPENPFQVGAFDFNANSLNNPTDLRIYNNFLFVSTYTKVVALDVSNPAYPVLVSEMSNPYWELDFLALDVQDNYLYVLSPGSLYIYDVNDVYTPIFISHTSTVSSGEGQSSPHLIVDGSFAYFLANELKLFNIQDIFNPTEVGFYRQEWWGEGYNSFKLANNYLYGICSGIAKTDILQNAILYPTAVEDKLTLPESFDLYQNYPNPFNPSTTISFSLPNAQHITLKVYDILGREIVSLVDEVKQAGVYSVSFNASNLSLASGVYLFQLVSGNFIDTKKMILMK